MPVFLQSLGMLEVFNRKLERKTLLSCLWQYRESGCTLKEVWTVHQSSIALRSHVSGGGERRTVGLSFPAERERVTVMIPEPAGSSLKVVWLRTRG
ncbi:hypothetical protein GJAV_G00242600 [Gymnothorax javanicus]|nr:hypothetical protein GJAV_G00242600 [Gymnothorax javanicus]